MKENNNKRDFKGIWVPKEIWFEKKLNFQEKLLLAEIDSLDNEDGCIASNKYFSEFFNLSETQISIYISKLKKLEYIYQEKFDGRRRILHSTLRILKGRLKENLKADLKKTKKQTLRKLKIYNKDNNKDNNKVYNYTEKDKFLTDLLYKLIKQNYPFLKEKDYLKDYAEMNKLNRIDGWTYEQIKYIINWSQNDSFWRQNIRSVSKLRKQFSSLVIRAKEKNQENQIIKV